MNASFILLDTVSREKLILIHFSPSICEADPMFQRQVSSLIHHQDVICGVAFGRFSLRRIVYTPQSALLGALQLTPCWWPGIPQNP